MLRASFTAWALALLLVPALGAHADNGLPSGPHVQVEGHGEVLAMPDLLIIQAQVSHTAETSAEARREVDEVAAELARVAERFQVAEEDVNASRIQIQPRYEWEDGKRLLVGQEASRQFELTLRDLERYGELVQALSETRLSAIHNLRFDFSNRTELHREAERRAAAAAREQAANLAEAMGARLGPVYRIQAGGAAPTPVLRTESMMMAARSADSDSGAPVQAARQRIEARLTAVYRIKP